MIMLHKEDTESGYQDPFNSEEKILYILKPSNHHYGSWIP